MSNKLIYMLLICLCLSEKGFAFWTQPLSGDSNDEGKGIGFKIGYEYQKSTYLEAGLFFHKWRGVNGGPIGFKAIGVGGECRLGGNTFYYGPKLYAEATAFWFGARVGCTYLTDSKQGALIFAPEIGFTGAGYVYVYFGGNLNLTNRSFLDMNGFRLSIGVNLYALDEL